VSEVVVFRYTGIAIEVINKGISQYKFDFEKFSCCNLNVGFFLVVLITANTHNNILPSYIWQKNLLILP